MNYSRILKEHYAILLLFVIGLSLRIILALNEPFLHTWDEQFHALVAQNMIENPFKPLLVKEVYAPYNYTDWSTNHIWLHKQPLFLWQMALSMKIFGVSIFAMRLPSILMGSLAIFLLYRIGLIWSRNKTIALIAASFYTFSYYNMELIVGIRGMDHNDIAFHFYTLASLWSYAEFQKEKKWYWIALIGLFSGAAILNKWLLGLLVYLGWGINLLLNFIKKELTIKECISLLTALFISIIVVLPWQIYILNNYPLEAQHEFAYNTKHVFSVVEGHAGEWYYYFENFTQYFGFFLNYLIIPIALLSFFIRKDLNRNLTIAFATELLFVFAFFSFLVQTKIITFIFFVVPLLFLFLAAGLYFIYQKIKIKPLAISLLIFLLFHNMRIAHLKAYFSNENEARNYNLKKHEVFSNLKYQLPQDINIIVHANKYEHPEIMFHNPNITAYHFELIPEILQELKAKNIRIATFKERDNQLHNEELKNYPNLYIIQEDLY